MAEFKKRKWNSPCPTLWQREFIIMHLIFNLIVYFAQLFKEENTIFRICWAVGPLLSPSTEQIAKSQHCCPFTHHVPQAHKELEMFCYVD